MAEDDRGVRQKYGTLLILVIVTCQEHNPRHAWWRGWHFEKKKCISIS